MHHLALVGDSILDNRLHTTRAIASVVRGQPAGPREFAACGMTSSWAWRDRGWHAP